MDKRSQHLLTSRRIHPCQIVAGLVCTLVLWTTACGSHQQVTIAVIPQTEGNMLWDPAHAGVEVGADRTGTSIYWNSPTRLDDVEAQIALVDRVADGNFQGLVLAPDQALSLIAPVRRALAHGIPTVIIGSPLAIPAGGNLSYILNDDAEGGRMAARRVAELVNGHGTVALLGINPDILGITIRARAFEQFLAQNYPNIRIVEKRMGTFNEAHEQQAAEETLNDNPHLDVIVGLMWPTIDGTLSALDRSRENRSVKIIGFDPLGFPPFEKENLDCAIQQDTRSMGEQAIESIYARRLGKSVPDLIYVQPRLINRQNVDSPEVRLMTSADWKLGHWNWSPAQ